MKQLKPSMFLNKNGELNQYGFNSLQTIKIASPSRMWGGQDSIDKLLLARVDKDVKRNFIISVVKKHNANENNNQNKELEEGAIDRGDSRGGWKNKIGAWLDRGRSYFKRNK